MACLLPYLSPMTGLDWLLQSGHRGKAWAELAVLGLLLFAVPLDAHAAPVFSGRSLSFDVGTGVSSLAVAVLDGDARSGHIAPNRSVSFAASIFWGEGDGTYGSKLSLTTAANPKGVAIGDLNADGRRDLVVACSGANAISIFFATGPRAFGPRQDITVGTYPV